MTSTGYTRQAAANIATGLTIQAADFNAEYNQIQSAFDGTTGHDHTGGTGLSQKIVLTTAVTGILPAGNGGTGVNNGSSTITLGGSLTLSGAYTFTGTLTSNTSVTFPTTGTLVNSAVTTLSSLSSASSLATVGTIATGVWNGTAVTPAYGGTGATSLTAHSLVIGNGTGTVLGLAPSTTGNICISNGTDWTSAAPTTLTTVGTISTGIWQGTKIGLAYGGTNADLSATGGTSQVLKQTSVGGNISVAQLSVSDLSTSTTGADSIVLSTGPSLVAPILGVASATSINKVTITAPATGSTLTISNGKTLSVSNTLTLTGTDSSSVAFGAGGTVAYTNVATLSSLASIGTITSGAWNGTRIGAAYGGTNIDSSASTGIAQVSSGTWSISTALASGTTATTQSVNDSSTKVATTAFANPASSLGASGYAELPSGLILQWKIGTNIPSLGGGGATTQAFTFPLQFPTAVYAVIPFNGPAGPSGFVYSIATSPTTSGCTVDVFNASGGTSQGTPAIYAIGS